MFFWQICASAVVYVYQAMFSKSKSRLEPSFIIKVQFLYNNTVNKYIGVMCGITAVDPYMVFGNK